MKVRIAGLMLTLLLGGCSSLLSTPPAATTHTLTWVAPASGSQAAPLGVPGQAPGQAPEITVQIIETTAAPGYTSAAMVYRKAPHELRSFAQHRWVEPPARLIAQALQTGLGSTGLGVVRAGTGAHPDLRLLSELLLLEQDFTQHPSQVRLTLRMQLVQVRTGRLLGTRTVALHRAAASENPDGGVAAANALLTDLIAAAQSFIDDFDAGAGKPAPGAQIPAR